MVTKEVFWLQITVQIVVFVHVTEALERLEHDIPNHLLREKLTPLSH